jgi:uncharacterized repeat protein (TIGR03803 family)
MTIGSSAQTLTTLASFSGSNGANPQSTLIQGIDGSLYGTTSVGGAHNLGTVFKVTLGGTLTSLHDFAGRPSDGANPYAGLVQASDGNFYGTTPGGGDHDAGTIFKITPTGTLTILHSFSTTDGANPRSALIQGMDGNLYGTTQNGGLGGGTVFKTTLSGTLSTVYKFCTVSNCGDGFLSFGGLVQGSDGNFYGTTNQGGANHGGTIFKVTPGGTLTTLYSFCSQMSCTDGSNPFGVLTQGIDGNFYGTTGEGGTGIGTVFKITPSGTLTTLHTFSGPDGGGPEDAMVQATDGNFYGTTNLFGANSGGTVFKVTPSGTFSTVYNFCSLSNCSDGRSSFAGLVQASDGNFYGTTYYGGGPSNSGTAFRLSIGIVLSPVQFIPVAPCRLVDTRGPNGEFGGPALQGGTPRFFVIPDNTTCNIPATAAAYSLNVTVVPHGSLGYLTIWPTGKNQPVASTLNSPDGRTKANAAIVPVGVDAAVSVFASQTTDLVLDIDGYFAPMSGSTLEFYPLAPCRVADTRNANEPQGLGPPALMAGMNRDFPVLNAASCNIPSSALAYSLNLTAVPHGTLGYLTVCPTPSGNQNCPLVSTLNSAGGQNTANAAIVPAGVGGAIRAFAPNDTDFVIDINGYFGEPGQGGLSLYPVPPCRVLDTRPPAGSGPFQFELNPPVDVRNSPCAPPSQAQAYVFNATVVPQGRLGFLTLWPDGGSQPVVSTLNAADGVISSNMAVVPAGATNGKVDAYAMPVNQQDPNDLTNLILDISSYFAP